MKKNYQTSSTDTEHAITQVLQAERDAEQAVRDCEHEAQQIIRDAHIKAQRIHTHTDQRITNMEMRHAHKIDKMVKAIEKQGIIEVNQVSGQVYESARLSKAINELVREIFQIKAGESHVPDTD